MRPTFFEFMTAAGFWAARESGADADVVEVGLGGRLDATNVIDPDGQRHHEHRPRPHARSSGARTKRSPPRRPASSSRGGRSSWACARATRASTRSSHARARSGRRAEPRRGRHRGRARRVRRDARRAGRESGSRDRSAAIPVADAVVPGGGVHQAVNAMLAIGAAARVLAARGQAARRAGRARGDRDDRLPARAEPFGSRRPRRARRRPHGPELRRARGPRALVLRGPARRAARRPHERALGPRALRALPQARGRARSSRRSRRPAPPTPARGAAGGRRGGADARGGLGLDPAAAGRGAASSRAPSTSRRAPPAARAASEVPAMTVRRPSFATEDSSAARRALGEHCETALRHRSGLSTVRNLERHGHTGPPCRSERSSGLTNSSRSRGRLPRRHHESEDDHPGRSR